MRRTISGAGQAGGHRRKWYNGESIFQTRVDNASGLNRGVRQVTLDGKVLPGNETSLLSDGRQHQVHVLMG
jgi:hypothetical protein